MRTRVKICGMTRPDDALAAARLGADAIGLVFYPSSPRAVSVAQAQAIRQVLPPFVTAVGLFVNAGADEIRRVIEAVPLDAVQFHGDESPDACRAVGRAYIKALRMREGLDVRAEAARYGDASGILLDTYREGVPGGTGQCFDWSRVPAGLSVPLILAGGLTPENVVEAIDRVHPYAVDVSGGVESARGIKDINKMRAFFEGIASVKTD